MSLSIKMETHEVVSCIRRFSIYADIWALNVGATLICERGEFPEWHLKCAKKSMTHHRYLIHPWLQPSCTNIMKLCLYLRYVPEILASTL